ncbi:hypothetical protein [Streptomyces sp. NBC_01304]|uniref:hypothetical protein n=1 Tax=Streptomyces sp. NBC_01304 TaxID=2903818 RepID=UPI002E151AAB|nr:hypothetical protein OG430_10150 [Streptomyces sp. NBC_01304]
MARVTGVKEKLHSPLYDAFFLRDDSETFEDRMTDPRVIRFFVDVQDKTRLETNMQAAGVLPSLNSFEARAMRVVVSDTAPVHDHPDPFIPDLIFSSVVTLLVGEKEAITAPTFMFPAGAGVFSGSSASPLSHGMPDPMATFRFAEPVLIEPQQNFRVEMLFPRGLPGSVARETGPRNVWVVLDGYLERDVQ